MVKFLFCLLLLTGCANHRAPIPMPISEPYYPPKPEIYPYNSDGVICYDLAGGIVVESGGSCAALLIADYIEILKNFYYPNSRY